MPARMSELDPIRRGSLPRALSRPLLLAALLVACVFAGYELLERLWLSDLDVAKLRALHLVRGVTASLLAAALVGWLVIRASPPLLERSPAVEGWLARRGPTREQRQRNYATWFIVMRWIAVLVAAVLAVLVVRVLGLLPATVWWPLVGVIALLAVMNLGYMWLVRRQPLPGYLLPMQAYGDLVILTLLLHFSGGVENPLSPLMLFHVIIAGVVLSRAHCYGVAATGSVLFALVATAEATHILPHYSLEMFPHHHSDEFPHAAHQPLYVVSHVALHAAILFLAAYFVGTLGERLRHDEAQLIALADQATAHRQLVEQSLETTEAGLCVCNQNAETYWTNQRWRDWFEHASLDRLASRCGCGENSPARQSLRDGKRRVTELKLPPKAPGDVERTFQVTTALLGADGSGPTHVVSLARDITEQQQMQAQMLRAGKLAAVGELAGQVAHEVNNPIAIISAKARLLLEDDPTPEKVRSELVKITQLADRVAQIAQGLLSYCRPSPATRAPLDVRGPIREALRTIDHRAKGQRVVMEDRLPDGLPQVHANAGEMQQVFLNLLLNALDAMPDGGQLTVAGSVLDEDEADPRGRRLQLCVADTGCGVPETIQEQVFEPFYTTKAEGRGTGLGLSICAGLVRSHGGRIYLRSTEGQGTEVFVELPIDAARGNDDE